MPEAFALPPRELEELIYKNLVSPLLLSRRARVCLSWEWGANHPDHRTQLREDILQKATLTLTHGTNQKTKTILNDLKKPPNIESIGLSISHCPNLGGYILISDTDERIGFDIELHSRVTTPVAARVYPHKPEIELKEKIEADTSVFPAIAWSAKESAIKYFGNCFPQRVLNFTNVSVTNISESSQNSSYHFTAEHGHHTARGLVLLYSMWVFALAVKPSQIETNSY